MGPGAASPPRRRRRAPMWRSVAVAWAVRSRRSATRRDYGGAMRPIIGMTTYVERATWGVWHDVPTTLLPHDYVSAVTLAGGRVVLLPPDDDDADVLRALDGLVL